MTCNADVYYTKESGIFSKKLKYKLNRCGADLMYRSSNYCQKHVCQICHKERNQIDFCLCTGKYPDLKTTGIMNNPLCRDCECCGDGVSYNCGRIGIHKNSSGNSRCEYHQQEMLKGFEIDKYNKQHPLCDLISCNNRCNSIHKKFCLIHQQPVSKY